MKDDEIGRHAESRLVSIARCVFRGRLRPQPQPRYAVCLRSKATERLEAAWRLQPTLGMGKGEHLLSGDKRRTRAACESESLPERPLWDDGVSRCEGRNADGGEAVDSGTSRLCTRGDGVLSRCTTNLLSPPPRFTPPLLLSASLALSVSPSPKLSRPQPPSTTHIPRLRRATPPMSSTPLGGLPFCLLSRSGTQKQRCHVLYSPIAL